MNKKILGKPQSYFKILLIEVGKRVPLFGKRGIWCMCQMIIRDVLSEGIVV